jgi:hypothetical protein
MSDRQSMRCTWISANSAGREAAIYSREGGGRSRRKGPLIASEWLSMVECAGIYPSPTTPHHTTPHHFILAIAV